MKPVTTFQAQPRHFWAHIKLLSEGLGYSSGGIIKRYALSELKNFLISYGLSVNHLDQSIDANTTYGDLVIDYISYRADILEKSVEANLMKKEQAKSEFEQLCNTYKGTLSFTYNKQSGEKRHPAYLTCIVNLLTEQTLEGPYFNHNPQGLIVVTDVVKPLRILSRRMDGAYPSIGHCESSRRLGNQGILWFNYIWKSYSRWGICMVVPKVKTVSGQH